MICDLRPIDKLYGYCDAVLSGEVIACKALKLAVERFISEVNDPNFPYVFEESIVNLYCEMIPEVFRHFEGDRAGHPFEPEPWQIFLIGNVFAWKRRVDGKRRFKKAFVYMGRKGGKSIIAAIFEIILARLDGEGGAQVYSTASKMDQAKIVHRMVELMVKASPALMDGATVHKNNIMFPGNSFIRPLGSDRPFDGTNTHAIVLDELHAWQEFHRPFYETMISASGTRSQPLEFIITTAGTEKSYIFHEELKYARGILNGTIPDLREFVLIFELDKEHDFMADDFDLDLMEQANPNLGVSVPLEFYRDELTKARHKPSASRTFKLKFANQCASSIEGGVIKPEVWDALAGTLSDWGTSAGIGAGVDIGGRDDLAAYGLCAKFPMDDSETPIYRKEVTSKAFIAEDTKRDLSQEPFRTWIDTGKLIVCEYVIGTLKEHLIEDCQQYGIEFVAYDPYQATQLAEDLEKEGLKPVKMPQNHGHFSETMDELFEEIAEKRFKPDELDEVLRWCSLNMAIDTNSKNFKMASKKHSKEKIDAMVAVLMAKRACNVAQPVYNGSYVF